jgi:hypothetical protein
MERLMTKVCTYCGREGRRASNCPMRGVPATGRDLLVAVVLVTLIALVARYA